MAHRRRGHLAQAYRELEGSPDGAGASRLGPQSELAWLRTDWLAGRVDHVVARFAAIEGRSEHASDRFLASEFAFEFAAKVAWLGDGERARALISAVEAFVPELPGALVRILRLISLAAISVADGDEPGAAALLRNDELAEPGRSDSWYWRDRAAIALPYVLVPWMRPGWGQEPLGPAHRPGLCLARALAAAREGNLAQARDLEWPDAGLVRASLPAPWVAELAAAATVAGNPPGDDLLPDAGPPARQRLRQIGAADADPRVRAVAARLAAAIPVEPPYRLRIEVLGPLRVVRGGEVVPPGELRRRRVRELVCCLVAHRRARRELIADELWPERADSGNNLRVNLAHLQRLLQPDRPDGEPPYFLRADKSWLALDDVDGLDVDVWELDAHLDTADAAERAGNPAGALAAYRVALVLWRGEPFSDAPDADWALPERARLRIRFSAAAVRAGDLLLAAGSVADARSTAHLALGAEPLSEPAYRLIVRSHLAEHDTGAARRALDDCRAALARFDLEPEPSTLALLE